MFMESETIFFLSILCLVLALSRWLYFGSPVRCLTMFLFLFKMCGFTYLFKSLIRAWNRALFDDFLFYFIFSIHALFLLFSLYFWYLLLSRVLDYAHPSNLFLV